MHAPTSLSNEESQFFPPLPSALLHTPGGRGGGVGGKNWGQGGTPLLTLSPYLVAKPTVRPSIFPTVNPLFGGGGRGWGGDGFCSFPSPIAFPKSGVKCREGGGSPPPKKIFGGSEHLPHPPKKDQHQRQQTVRASRRQSAASAGDAVGNTVFLGSAPGGGVSCLAW